MRLHIGRPKDAIAGCLFLAIGAGAWFQAESYPIGTATRMGPGYFPHVLGALLALLGVANLLRSFGYANAGITASPRRFTPLLLVLGGVLAFWLLIDRAGLIAATFALVLIACAPQLRRRPVEVLLIACVLAAFSVAVFIYGFSMPFRAY